MINTGGTNKAIGGSRTLAIGAADMQQNIEFLQTMEQKTESLKLRYYTWLSRLFIFFATLSCLFMVLASLSLFRLAPAVSVEPFLIINQNTSKGIVRQEAITSRMASKTQLMETFIRQYVIVRNTVINDVQEMRTRWFRGGMVNFLSAPLVFESFYANRENIMSANIEKGLSREVEIIKIYQQGGDKSPIWKVDFKTYDLYAATASTDLVFSERYWTASVEAYFFRERMFMGRRLINPMGFTVTRYSQTEVEIL